MWILFAALRVPFVSSGVDVVGANFRTCRFIRSRLLAVWIRSASIVLRTYRVPSGFGIVGRGPNVSLCRFGRIGSAVSVRSKKEGWDRNSLSFASPISDRRRQPFLGWSIHYGSDLVLSTCSFRDRIRRCEVMDAPIQRCYPFRNVDWGCWHSVPDVFLPTFSARDFGQTDSAASVFSEWVLARCSPGLRCSIRDRRGQRKFWTNRISGVGLCTRQAEITALRA